MDDKRWKQRLLDFGKALKKLEDGLKQKKFDELEKDGVIQRFEFTFELGWKTMKDYLEYAGHADVVSPKRVLRQAFVDGLIGNGIA